MKEKASDDFTTNQRRVEFWPGKVAELDILALINSAVRVKGTAAPLPLRCLDIYLNTEPREMLGSPLLYEFESVDFTALKNIVMPTCNGKALRIGDNIPQPPFAWRDATPFELGLSFTYSTNGFFRILMNLRESGTIEETDLSRLLDQACLLLSALYKADDYSLIKNINNNLNMYLIPKVIEQVVGKNRFDASCQELTATRSAVNQAIILAYRSRSLSTLTKMKISLGMGISFTGNQLLDIQPAHTSLEYMEAGSHRYDDSKLAIDHRLIFLDMISNASHRGHFSLAVVLDDAAESVNDLLWLQDLIQEYSFLSVTLLINSRQVSVNFSVHHMQQIYHTPLFYELTSRIGSQVHLKVIDFPLISFQPNYLPGSASQVISDADALYIKGANFFETCQLREKETFYAFVVYGNISRRYSGLNNFDGVFAYVPSGIVGYTHNSENHLITLKDIVAPHSDCNPSTSLEEDAEFG